MRSPRAAKLVGAMTLAVVGAAASVSGAQGLPVPREAFGARDLLGVELTFGCVLDIL